MKQILDKIDENQLFVPAFQRGYVWKRNNAKKLIDSLIKEYGTMLTWETNNPPKLKGKWNKPLYVETIDKNGQKSKKFYVRTGNSSQELGLDEISDYINSKFNNGGSK